MTNEEEIKIRKEYINTHRHDWTMHQEADYWLAKLKAQDKTAREALVKKINEFGDIWRLEKTAEETDSPCPKCDGFVLEAWLERILQKIKTLI